jgi:phage terminase large subunit
MHKTPPQMCFLPESTIRHRQVDAIGIGHNFGLHLGDCRFPVDPINVSRRCESSPHLGDDDPALRFVNLKACFYQALADAFERDQIEGLTDETTIGQLASLIYEIDSQGRLKLESKEQARARGVPSPDRAEALMLALCKPPQKIEYRSARDLPSSNAQTGICPFDEDAQARVRPRRWPRGFELF